MLTTLKKFLPGSFKTFLRIAGVTKNWPALMLVKWGLKKETVAKFRRGYSIPVSRASWGYFMGYVGFLWQNPRDWEIVDDKYIRISYEGKPIVIYFGQWGPSFGEMFLQDPYKKYVDEANLNGRPVIDIGANIGDSAIYFALHGAKRVTAFEPFPGWYRLAQENIKANKLENVCEVVGMGVGGRSGELTEDETYNNFFKGDANTPMLMKGANPDGKLPMISLSEIVNKYGVDKGFLKVDCEGYEYDILLNTPDDILRHFDYIIIEYHYGPQGLTKKLRSAGFDTENSLPETEKDLANKAWNVGYLFARPSQTISK